MNYKEMDSSQFPFIIRKMYKNKEDLLKWAKNENKNKLVKSLMSEIEILKETERRLEDFNSRFSTNIDK